MSTRHFEEVCEILEVIADNYEDPEQAIKRLCDYKKAPRTLEEMEKYIRDICNDLLLRELGEEKIFPNIEYEKLVEMLGKPLRKIFEKTSRKLILLGNVKNGMVGIHPFLCYFYNSLKSGFTHEDWHYFKKLKIEFINEQISLDFDGVELYLPLSLFDEPQEFYLALNQEDASYLGLNFDGNKIVTNYKIREHLDGSLSIEILKQDKQEKLSVVMQLPELFSEIKEDTKELWILIGSDFKPYLEAKLIRERLIGKLEEACLENENFYKKLIQTREADQRIPPNIPLLSTDLREYKKLYEEALIELEDYMKEREKDIERKKKKIMERLVKEEFL